MKSKMIVPTLNPRNPFVTLAHKRKAGSHAKSHKAQRKQDKQRGYSSMVEHPAFNRSTTDRYRVPPPVSLSY